MIACGPSITGVALHRVPALVTYVQMRTQGNTATFGDVTISLAQAYGFCWGVERAVQMAYEARTQYPGAKLFMTNEIIHNPGVNAVCFLIEFAIRLCLSPVAILSLQQLRGAGTMGAVPGSYLKYSTRTGYELIFLFLLVCAAAG